MEVLMPLELVVMPDWWFSSGLSGRCGNAPGLPGRGGRAGGGYYRMEGKMENLLNVRLNR